MQNFANLGSWENDVRMENWDNSETISCSFFQFLIHCFVPLYILWSTASDPKQKFCWFASKVCYAFRMSHVTWQSMQKWQTAGVCEDLHSRLFFSDYLQEKAQQMIFINLICSIYHIIWLISCIRSYKLVYRFLNVNLRWSEWVCEYVLISTKCRYVFFFHTYKIMIFKYSFCSNVIRKDYFVG